MENYIWILAIASGVQFAITLDLVEDSPNGDGELIFAHVVS